MTVKVRTHVRHSRRGLVYRVREFVRKGEGKTQSLFSLLHERGGFTYDPVHHKMPTSGYAVSVTKQFEQKYDASKVDPDTIRRFINANAKFILAHEDAHVGGWLDTKTGKAYLDISQVVKSKQQAIKLAHAHKQLAIYDLGKNLEIRAAKAQKERFIRFDFPARMDPEQMAVAIKRLHDRHCAKTSSNEGEG